MSAKVYQADSFKRDALRFPNMPHSSQSRLQTSSRADGDLLCVPKNANEIIAVCLRQIRTKTCHSDMKADVWFPRGSQLPGLLEVVPAADEAPALEGGRSSARCCRSRSLHEMANVGNVRRKKEKKENRFPFECGLMWRHGTYLRRSFEAITSSAQLVGLQDNQSLRSETFRIVLLLLVFFYM